MDVRTDGIKISSSEEGRHDQQQYLLISNYVFFIRPKKKICVFTVTRPTLIFASDPMHFYTEFG